MTLARKEKYKSLIAAVPAIALFTIFVYYPLIMTIRYSLTDWNGYSANYNFVGLKNFLAVFRDTKFFQSFKNTIYFSAVSAIAGTILQFSLALILHGSLKGRNALKAIFYIPSVISMMIVALTWRQILQYNGIINELMKTLGLGKYIIDWIGDPKVAMNALIAVNTWQYLGTGIIIFLAGLSSIPQQIYEASDLDGASGFARFRHITLPLVMPSVTIVGFMAITGTLKQFSLSYVLTNGGPLGSTRVLALHIYETAFANERFGIASAIGFMFFLFIAFCSIIQLKFTRKREVEY
ncbi:MAG: sugar ABC transporter permease [Clostridiaceae bacterium]